MKKTGLIAAALCFTLQGICQTSVIGDNKASIRDKKTETLNGKTFKVTFSDQTITQNNSTSFDKSMENKNDAEIKNDMNSDNTIDHGVQNNTGTIDKDKNMDNKSMNNGNNQSMNNANKRNAANDQSTTPDKSAMHTYPEKMNEPNMQTTDYSSYENNMKGKTMEITFTDNEIQSNMFNDHQFNNCPYNVSASTNDMISFYSNCHNADRVNSQIAGIVEGNTISGSMTYSEPNGKIIKYSFNGSKVNSKKKHPENTSEKTE